MTWDGCCVGDYSFSLRNELGSAVKDVWCLVVFYDPSGNQLDFRIFAIPDVIPAGLSKRISREADETIASLNSPNHNRRVDSGSRHNPPESRVEFKILDFKIVQ